MKWLAAITLFVMAALIAQKDRSIQEHEAERIRLTQEIDRQYRFRSIAESKLASLESERAR